MKVYFLIIFIIFSLTVKSQTTVIGHVYAEIIESVSIPKITTNFTINSDSSKVNIGTIKVISSNIVIGNAIDKNFQYYTK